MRKILALLASVAVLAGTAAAAALTYDTWQQWLPRGLAVPPAEEEPVHAHESKDRVRLSTQARSNLRLVVEPIQSATYTRHVTIPGAIVERPGCDRGVTSPVAGVVQRVGAIPGETVRPGDVLLVLRVVSEYLQTSQTELFKTVREMQIVEEKRQRLEKAGGAVAGQELIDLEAQQRRLQGTLQALRFDLSARGLTPEQIQGVTEGKFVTEVTVRVPAHEPEHTTASLNVPAPEPHGKAGPPLYEVEELRVQLGDQVQAGQLLCTLADHHVLYVEGRPFRQEVPFLERAAQHGWPVRAEFAEEVADHWPALTEPLKIRFLGNRVDPASQTIPVYAPLANPFREYSEGGKTFRLWRFRPGERVRLQVPVERFADVFVLPAAAVVREGPEAFVFRANGDAFDRKPVHVLFEDRQNVVIANDGSISAGNYIARNGAAQLNRVLKAQASGGGGHDHHDHEH